MSPWKIKLRWLVVYQMLQRHLSWDLIKWVFAFRGWNLQVWDGWMDGSRGSEVGNEWMTRWPITKTRGFGVLSLRIWDLRSVFWVLGGKCGFSAKILLKRSSWRIGLFFSVFFGMKRKDKWFFVLLSVPLVESVKIDKQFRLVLNIFLGWFKLPQKNQRFPIVGQCLPWEWYIYLLIYHTNQSFMDR